MASSQFNFDALTLNAEEARSISECLIEEVYQKPEIANVHGIQTGIDVDRFIPIFGQLGLVGKLDPGSCASNVAANVIPTSQKKWEPKLVSFRLEHCEDLIPDLFKVWKKARMAAGRWEEVNNEEMAFITDRAIDATTESILRLTEFGNKTISAIGDATGDQTLTAGTDKGFFNVINGMWQQVFTDAGTKSYRYTIDENATSSKAAQTTLAVDRALQVFRNLYNNIDPRAFNGQNLVFQVTRSLFNNWQDMMEDKSMVFMLNRTEQGSTSWSYRGIPIVVRNDWDRTIRTYMDNGTVYNLPNRAILADINNIPIGTSDTESFKEFRSFYDFKTKTHLIDVAYRIDQKNLLEYNIASAY